jgi:hypothetical protein
MEELHASFEQYKQLHQHLKKFDVIPTDFKLEVAKVYSKIKIQKFFARDHHQYNELLKVLQEMNIDFYLAGTSQ